jgi:hypothetical protein
MSQGASHGLESNGEGLISSGPVSPQTGSQTTFWVSLSALKGFQMKRVEVNGTANDTRH